SDTGAAFHGCVQPLAVPKWLEASSRAAALGSKVCQVAGHDAPAQPPIQTGGLMSRCTAVGLLALTLALPLPAFAQAGTGDLRAQIEKSVQAWQKAYNAGDAAAVTAL